MKSSCSAPRGAALLVLVVGSLALGSCGGKSSSRTAPVVLPSYTLGTALRLFVGPSFAVPSNVDTTASLLVSLDNLTERSALGAFVSNLALVDAGHVYILTPPDSTELIKAAGQFAGKTYVAYSTALPPSLPTVFDGVTQHHFRVTGAGAIPAFVDSVRSVAPCNATAPTFAATVSRGSDLAVTWSDGGVDASVKVVATVIASSDTTKHVTGIIADDTAGTLTIPTTQLSLLPAGGATLAVARYRIVYTTHGAQSVGMLVEAVRARPITLN